MGKDRLDLTRPAISEGPMDSQPDDAEGKPSSPAGPLENDLVLRGPLGPEYAVAVSALVRRVFLRFEAPEYPQEGVDTFFVFTDPEFLAFSIRSGMLTVCGCFDRNQLVGVVALRDRTHVSLLFVESTRHRRGIGTALMEWAFRYAGPRDSAYPVMTVNSSPYARGFYERIGFSAIGQEQRKDGIRFIPMARKFDV